MVHLDLAGSLAYKIVGDFAVAMQRLCRLICVTRNLLFVLYERNS